MNLKEFDAITNRLAEEFESVLILVSTNENGVTRSCVKRRGNYYASRGLAQHWLEEERNTELAEQIADKTKED